MGLSPSTTKQWEKRNPFNEGEDIVYSIGKLIAAKYRGSVVAKLIEYMAKTDKLYMGKMKLMYCP